MINKEELDSTHIQYGNSCLLSNYAVCCNYFTQIAVPDYFYDYLNEFESDFNDSVNFLTVPYVNMFLNDRLFELNYMTIDF